VALFDKPDAANLDSLSSLRRSVSLIWPCVRVSTHFKTTKEPTL